MGYTQDAEQIVLINEIKKALYKQKPLAIRTFMNENIYKYKSSVDLPDIHGFHVVFTIPVKDMGETEFTDSIRHNY